MHCRRCPSPDLIPLDRLQPTDHQIYRCRRCGYLFSPANPAPAANPQPTPTSRK